MEKENFKISNKIGGLGDRRAGSGVKNEYSLEEGQNSVLGTDVV